MFLMVNGIVKVGGKWKKENGSVDNDPHLRLREAPRRADEVFGDDMTPQKLIKVAGDQLEYEIDNLAQSGPGTNPKPLRDAIKNYIEVCVTSMIYNSAWDHANITKIGGIDK